MACSSLLPIKRETPECSAGEGDERVARTTLMVLAGILATGP